MSNNKAFVHKIGPFGSGQDEHNAVHQAEPHWVLTFVRWADRDTLRSNATENKDFTSTRATDPLVVENDCLAVNVNVNKGTLTHSMSATLVFTDVNYMTDIAPGDFCVVNMLNWQKDARRVADQARAQRAINGWDDGFKGLFKVQSVRKKVAVIDPTSGTKAVFFTVTGFAFTEFNNTIYFQPEMINNAEKDNVALYTANIQSNWSLLVSSKGLTSGQDLIQAVTESFIGSGLGDDGIRDKLGNVKSPNTLFYVPKLVGTLLGVKGATAAKDIYNFLFGIQKYASGSAATKSAGFNPVNIDTIEGRFTKTKLKCRGESLQKPEYWNQVKLWSIMNQFTNSPLNEMFTCFRVGLNGRIMPTVVYRQIPFTTEDFKEGNFEVTRFMNIPRWKISPALVYSVDIGRDEAARINFVQYFGRSSLSNGQWGTSSETAARNYLFDIDDVKRSGLRPYVVSSNFDITKNNEEYASPYWARIVGDALIGGHLKLNGTLEVAGIVDPIAVGDNLEFDGAVFHIEEIAHNCTISDGKRMFRTKVSLSSGLSKDSSSQHGTRYAEMTYSQGQAERIIDHSNNQILPGVSESQDVVYRKKNVDVDDTYHGNGPFAQPNIGVNINSSQRDAREKDKK